MTVVISKQNFSYNNQPYIKPVYNSAFRSLSVRSKNTMLKRSRSVFGGIIRTKGPHQQYKYALVQGRYTGKWSFPKGHANIGENPIDCSLREIYEETGINKLPMPSEMFRTIHGQYFTFDVPGEIPLRPTDTNEIVQTRWVTLDDMTRMSVNADVLQYIKWKHQ